MSHVTPPMKPHILLLVGMFLAAAPALAETFPGEMSGDAVASAQVDASPVGTERRSDPAPKLMAPGTGPSFGGLFVLVLPWHADRHLIQARRRLQFALRLDEPKEPAFKLTLRF